jgi:Glycosyl transferase family 2
VLCFGTLDDADVIEYFIEYHIASGVDAFVATDVGSTDGTLDILSHYERLGKLLLTRLQNPEIGDVERDWSSAMARVAREHFGAGWCLFGDADEFWVFPNNDAQRYFASRRSEIVIFPRYNMVPTRDQGTGAIAHFKTFDLVVRRPLEIRYDVSRRSEPEGVQQLLVNYPPEILRVVMPKVAAPAAAIRSVDVGFHNVVSNDPGVPRHYEPAGFVAHYPARSVEQWRRKAQHVSRFTDYNSPEHYLHSSQHWVRLSAIFKRGLTDEDFYRQVLSAKEIESRILEGVLKRDNSISRHLMGLLTKDHSSVDS